MQVPDLEIKTNKDLLTQIYRFKKMRENYEPLFYLARKAYEGKHFVAWDREQRTLTETSLKPVTFNQLPEVAKQADSYENFLLSTDFIFTVVPQRLSDDQALKDSMGLSLLAKNYYDKLKDSTIFGDYINSALKDNVSFIEVAQNAARDDVEYRQFDGFDILFNPLVKDWDKQTLVVKVVRKTKTQLTNSKLYKLPILGQVSSVSTEFISWKDIYEAEKYSSFANLQKDEFLLFEC